MVTYFIMNVEVFCERVTSGRNGLIVGNMNGVIEVVGVYQRHVEGCASLGTLESERASTMVRSDDEDTLDSTEPKREFLWTPPNC